MTIVREIIEKKERYVTSAVIKVEPEIFHIHYDSSDAMPEVFVSFLHEAGFVNSDFDFTKKFPNQPYYAAIRHMTLKVKAENLELLKNRLVDRGIDVDPGWWAESSTVKRMNWVFNQFFDITVAEAKKNEFKGYVEGEFITVDMQLSDKPLNKEEFHKYYPYPCPDVWLPIHIYKRALHGHPEEPFRKGEIHITMDADKSATELSLFLNKMGLSRTVIPKNVCDTDGKLITNADGSPQIKNDAIFTVQGPNFLQLQTLFTDLAIFIYKVGGAVSCTMKLEHVPRHYVSPGTPYLSPSSALDLHGVPPVIDRIFYRDRNMGKATSAPRNEDDLKGLISANSAIGRL